jgi:8-oxo-dGTP pyrophosphatase MutT (NUDIX family)
MSSPFDVLDQKYPDIRFELYPTEKAKRVYLTGFIVPYTMRGQGVGSSFMNDLTKIADDNGWKITLTPSDSYGGNVSRLKKFYKEFGFIENKGQDRDFSHREDMYRDPQGSLNEEVNKMRKTMRLDEASSKYTVDTTPEELMRRVPFLKTFKNFSDNTRLQFQKVTNNENVELYNKDGEAILFKQFNLSSEFNYSIVDMYDGRHRFMVSLKHQTWLMPPEVKDREQELYYRVMTMAMTKQMESLGYSYDEVLEQETLMPEQWNEIVNKLNESFFKLENYLDEVLPVELVPHLDEDKKMNEVEEKKEKSRIALLFIVIDNKVLLFKRSPEETTNPGKYGMLGGHIEKGETPEDALKREIKEEAGVELGSFKKLKTYELDDVQLNVFYTNEFDVDNVKLDKKEHTAKKFFTLEELDEMSPEECIDTNKGIARDYNKKAKEDKQLNETIERMKSIIRL